MDGWSIWNIVGSAFGLFSNVGNTVVTGSDTSVRPLVEPQEFVQFQEQTQFVQTLLSEVKTGWSFETMFTFWGPLLQIPILITLIFGTGTLYCMFRVFQIRRQEAAAFRAAATQAEPVHEESRTRLRWQRVLESASSDDPQKWRNAVLEADYLLNELLDTLGFKGETMGDKMRQADVAAFKTIDFAWEAHQMQNRIAQDPQFELDAREAKRVIKMYERVFEEFHFIGDHEHNDHH